MTGQKNRNTVYIKGRRRTCLPVTAPQAELIYNELSKFLCAGLYPRQKHACQGDHYQNAASLMSHGIKMPGAELLTRLKRLILACNMLHMSAPQIRTLKMTVTTAFPVKLPGVSVGGEALKLSHYPR